MLPTNTRTYTWFLYLPLISKPEPACPPIPGAGYATMLILDWQPHQVPVELNPNINLGAPGYTPTTAYLGLIDMGGDTDPNAPQLDGLFSTPRGPVFTAAYQVYDWDWENRRPTQPIPQPPVTLIDLAATPGETIHVPDSGYEIRPGYEVLVLYAEEQRITLHYTDQDTSAWGYTIHLEDICVDPNLLALYQTLHQEGRHELPMLRSGQAFAYARANRVGVAVRDTGALMDPRVRKDWWKNY